MYLTLKMTSAQVFKTSVNVTSNSPSQDYTHPDDHDLCTYDYTHADSSQILTSFIFALIQAKNIKTGLMQQAFSINPVTSAL